MVKVLRDLGFQPEWLVPGRSLTERSLEIIIGVLGVLKAEAFANIACASCMEEDRVLWK